MRRFFKKIRKEFLKAWANGEPWTQDSGEIADYICEKCIDFAKYLLREVRESPWEKKLDYGELCDEIALEIMTKKIKCINKKLDENAHLSLNEASKPMPTPRT